MKRSILALAIVFAIAAASPVLAHAVDEAMQPDASPTLQLDVDAPEKAVSVGDVAAVESGPTQGAASHESQPAYVADNEDPELLPPNRPPSDGDVCVDLSADCLRALMDYTGLTTPARSDYRVTPAIMEVQGPTQDEPLGRWVGCLD